jgi:hypothetical protein
MQPKQTRTIQTKLKLSNKNEDDWKTIGRAKRREQTSSFDQQKSETNKKTDTKKTPPRPDEQITTAKQELLKDPVLLTSTPSVAVGLDAESNLIADIKNSINSPSVLKHSSITPTSLDSVDFPPITISQEESKKMQ